MKYEESYPGITADVLDLIKKAIPDGFTKNLNDAGIRLTLPEDRELELKVKYNVDDDGGSLTTKILWDNETEDSDDEDEDKDDEEDKEDD